MKPTLLITGGSGLLALNWAATVWDRWNVVLALHRRIISPTFARTQIVDLFDGDAIGRVLDETTPELVVHAAGLTNIETCEADPDLAKRTNVDIARSMAKQCRDRDVGLIVISTDHLFSGGEKLIDENTPVAPINVYGRTKADGEKAALDINPQTLIARTNFFCWGPTYRHSFSDVIIDALRSNMPVSLFSDVYFTPILAAQLAITTHALVAKKASGIFNLSGDERLSKYEFGLRIAAYFDLDVSLIQASCFSDRNDLTPRPHEMGLDNSKAHAMLNKPLGDMDTYLQQLAEAENNPSVQELRKL